MPPQSRAQRRRQSTRQQQQQRRPNPPARSAEAVSEQANTGPTVVLDAGAPARPAPRPNRRVLSRPAPEPVDYSKDYAAVRSDLRWIALWTVLLFVAMIALRISGLV